MSPPVPRHAFNGHLLFTDGGSARVAISDTGEDIRLVVVRDAEALRERELDDVILESNGGHGIIRDRGRCSWIDANTIAFEREALPAVLQRRNHVRVDAPQQVRLTRPDGKELLNTYAVNLSGGGMLLALPRNFDPAPLKEVARTTPLDFELNLDESTQSVRGSVSLIRVDPAKGQLAVEYAKIDPHERERVIKFIFNRQRATIANSRARWL